jgi:hypothetical protein
MYGFRNTDLHTYADKSRKIREDFEKLKNAKDNEEVENMLEKYEFFMERTYLINPLNCKKMLIKFFLYIKMTMLLMNGDMQKALLFLAKK